MIDLRARTQERVDCSHLRIGPLFAFFRTGHYVLLSPKSRYVRCTRSPSSNGISPEKPQLLCNSSIRSLAQSRIGTEIVPSVFLEIFLMRSVTNVAKEKFLAAKVFRRLSRTGPSTSPRAGLHGKIDHFNWRTRFSDSLCKAPGCVFSSPNLPAPVPACGAGQIESTQVLLAGC